MSQNNNKSYTNALNREIWRIALPCVLENLLTFAAGLVIAAMIGRLTSDEISAQTIGNRITGVLQSLFKGIGVGTTVLIGVSYGMGKLGKCRKLAEEMMILMIPMSLLLSLVVAFWPVPFLRLFANDVDLIQMSIPYIRIAIWMIPAFAVSRIVTAAFTGQGNTRTPMIIAVSMNILNAILGYIFIFVLDLRLIGAAYALTLSYLYSMTAGLVSLYRKKGLYNGITLSDHRFKGTLSDIKGSFSTGLPASFENMMWSAVAIIMSRALLTYGTAEFAGYQLSSQVEEFMGAPSFGLQIAATTLIAQSLGRKDLKEGGDFHRQITKWGILSSLPIAVILLVFAPQLMMLLTDKTDIQQVGAIYLRLAALAFLPQTLNMIDFGAIRVASSRSFPLITTIVGMWCVRVPTAALAAWVLKADIWVVFAGIAFDQVVRWGIALIYRKKKNVFWNTKRGVNDERSVI